MSKNRHQWVISRYVSIFKISIVKEAMKICSIAQSNFTKRSKQMFSPMRLLLNTLKAKALYLTFEKIDCQEIMNGSTKKPYILIKTKCKKIKKNVNLSTRKADTGI